MSYRIYFKNQHGFVIGRDDFIADDDEHAVAIALALDGACTDVCTGIELWDGIRRVETSMRAAGKLSRSEIVEKVQDTVLEREIVLRESKWVLAQSARLLAETERLLDRQRPPSRRPN